MGRPRNALNVRAHLEHLERVIEVYREWGDCPLVREELKTISFVNRAIIRKHDAKRTLGDRKDIRVGAPANA